MALMNRLNARSVATLGVGKYNDGARLLTTPWACKTIYEKSFLVLSCIVFYPRF
ncbi:hypothetical protein [Bartonella massiliensis]|uniref:hypothetical protein n=1 Tax=Bartonella massiliensis TaxID=929795 RepID=UPI00163CE2FC|nr:hypothetical protein [Bartonella massiliensis]